MKKWKVELWIEDTPPEEDIILKDGGHLAQKDINIAMEKAKAAIEEEWNGLKVTDFDVYIDKETKQ